MADPFSRAAAVIRSVLGEPVIFTGAGLTVPASISVIWSDVSGDPFQGPGNTTRTISCEIAKDILPVRPGDDEDRIERKGIAWRIIEVIDRDDVGAWSVILEQAE